MDEQQASLKVQAAARGLRGRRSADQRAEVSARTHLSMPAGSACVKSGALLKESEWLGRMNPRLVALESRRDGATISWSGGAQKGILPIDNDCSAVVTGDGHLVVRVPHPASMSWKGGDRVLRFRVAPGGASLDEWECCINTLAEDASKAALPSRPLLGLEVGPDDDLRAWLTKVEKASCGHPRFGGGSSSEHAMLPSPSGSPSKARRSDQDGPVPTTPADAVGGQTAPAGSSTPTGRVGHLWREGTPRFDDVGAMPGAQAPRVSQQGAYRSTAHGCLLVDAEVC